MYFLSPALALANISSSWKIQKPYYYCRAFDVISIFLKQKLLDQSRIIHDAYTIVKTISPPQAQKFCYCNSFVNPESSLMQAKITPKIPKRCVTG